MSHLLTDSRPAWLGLWDASDLRELTTPPDPSSAPARSRPTHQALHPQGMCSRPEPGEPLRRVAVIGGTHGNEMSGICLARYWLQAPGELQRPSFFVAPVLANPAATAACRRYMDYDLNRAFTSALLT